MISQEAFQLSWSDLKKSKVFLAASGGVDSTVLIHLLHRMGVCFEVLHVNYSLRGLESQEDEAFLSALCFDLNIPISVNRIDFNSVLKKERSNLQESARDFRYSWFNSFLEKDESAVLVLAHHLDDQIETFFQHLARKSGIMGMACMLQRNGQFIRPLLQHSKTDIIEYAIDNKVSWREDSSNAYNKYTRNKLRNNFIPFVEAQVPSLKKSVQILIAVFQSEIKAITLSVSPIFDKVRTEKQIQFSDFDVLSDEQGVELMRLLAYPIDVFFKLKKIRYSQKGKLIKTLNHVFCREIAFFSIVEMNINKPTPKICVRLESILPNEFHKRKAYFDADKMMGEPFVRKWKTGDRMKPIGMKGSKLISDILSDAKASYQQKEDCLVVFSGNEIIWCVGYRISRIANASKGFNQILSIEISE